MLMRSRRLRQSVRVTTTMVVAALLAPTGCVTARTEPPAIDYNTLDDLDFMHDYIAKQPLVTVDEACKAILILADGEDKAQNFDERRAKLAERGILRESWGLAGDDYIDKGTLAYMVAQVCQMTGGVNRMILGSWGLGDRRYALRELRFRKVITSGVDYAFLTGGELMGILHRADEYMQNAGVYDAGDTALPDVDDPNTFAAPPAAPQ